MVDMFAPRVGDTGAERSLPLREAISRDRFATQLFGAFVFEAIASAAGKSS